MKQGATRAIRSVGDLQSADSEETGAEPRQLHADSVARGRMEGCRREEEMVTDPGPPRAGPHGASLWLG